MELIDGSMIRRGLLGWIGRLYTAKRRYLSEVSLSGRSAKNGQRGLEGHHTFEILARQSAMGPPGSRWLR